MIRRTLAAVSTAALVIALAPATPASAKDDPRPELKAASAGVSKKMDRGTALTLGKGNGSELYIVQLEDPAVPTRELASDDGGKTTRKVESARSYEQRLVAEQADLRSSIRSITGTPAKVRYSYTKALNGIAVELTRQQAQRVARIDGVTSVQVDFTRKIQTDRGPEWIGADKVWDGTAVPGGVGSKGEGVVVGILDTGLNPANPSFADIGGDGFDHENPLGEGNYLGVCATDPTWGCNDKLIGYWNFQGSEKYDDDGHGSHTASTSAGNEVEATAYSDEGGPHEFSVTHTIKGVAPHANIVGYDVCDGAGCQGTAIVAAIDQAIDDGVDAINYSIGSSSASNPWDDADTVGFLNARAAGIHVATSAGNDGPGAGTIGGPADAPWITSVGATTHDRKYVASVTDLSSDAGPGPADIAGAGLSGPSDGAFPIVYAGDAPYNNPRCESAYDEVTGDPVWDVDLSGKIILCDRGGNGRVEKGEIVAFLGAEGMVLANDAASGNSLNGDAHELPAAHITYDHGVALKAWMNSVTGEQVALSGSVIDIADANGDIMAAFSSRGPNRAVSMLSPSVSAPGVDILAAAGDLDGNNNDVTWHFISGTSMASPHTAGALALLKAVHPTWTPAEAQSALMTTAERDIADSDGTQADWQDMGSGRIELRRAAKAGLLLDEDEAAYLAANPAEGGDVRTLNTASMGDGDCLATCSWTRTFDVTSAGAGTWNVTVETMSDDLTLTPDKTSFTAAAGDQVTVTVDAEIAPGTSTEDWLFGTLVLTPVSGDAPTAHLPVGVVPSNGVLPDEVDITTRRDAGSQVSKNLMSVAIDDLQISASGLVPAVRKPISVVEDGTNLDPWDANSGHVENLTVPAGATRLVAQLEDPTAPDFDLYVGTGAVSEENVVCQSATGGSGEACDIANPEPGNWWVLVQNWEATAPGGTDTADLVTAVVAGDQGNLSATGPEGPLAAREPFDLRVKWDEPDMDAGETWYGSLTLGTGPGSAGNIGVIPVQVHRVADDVTKTADKQTAAPGDTITYTVEVQPNVSQEDLIYTIKDTLPEGTTYVDGSATGGATYADGVVSWSDTLETAYGKTGTYDFVTSAQDPNCVNPYTEEAEYVDVLSLNPNLTTNSTISGDTLFAPVLGSRTYGHYGTQYQGVGVTDDGVLVYGGSQNWAQTQSDEPWTVQSLPDPARPNNLVAPLWQDMEITYDEPTNKGVTVVTAGPDLAIVEYDDVHVYNQPGQSFDMEVFLLTGSSDVVFAYDNINGPLDEVTIGSENADGTAAGTLVNNSSAASLVTNDTVVCGTYTPATNTEAVEFTYQVTVDDDVHERQQLVNRAVHTTNDPAAKPETVSDTVKVTGSLERSEVTLTVSPDRFETNGTTTATATVFSAGEAAATGQVQFLVGTRVAGTAAVGADGKATATLSGFDTAGTFPVTAKYLGDAATKPSTSAPVNVVVSDPGTPPVVLADSATGVSVDPASFETGKTTNATASVASTGTAVPTGQVQFLVGTRVAGTAAVGADGKATATLSGFDTAGTFPVTAKYLGDAATKPSTSVPVNVVVTAPAQPAPKVRSKITIDAKKVVKKGSRATLEITVAAPKTVPSGSVTVTLKGGGLKKKDSTITATLDAYGKATIKTDKLTKTGKVKVEVVYSGDAAVEGSSKKFDFKVVKKKKKGRR